MTIYWPLITRFEARVTTGYVPIAANGTVEGDSGVTVATGVDLGALTPQTLAMMVIPDDLKAKLRPYVGVRTDAAVALLRSKPLTLTQDETDALDAAARGIHIAELRALYNRCVPPGLRGWTDLTDAQQTVIASVAWQYGYLPKDCPKFWEAAVHQRWRDVVAELRKFGDRYTRRRNAEADYLEGSLAA